jgi:hypothetical protein
MHAEVALAGGLVMLGTPGDDVSPEELEAAGSGSTPA